MKKTLKKAGVLLCMICISCSSEAYAYELLSKAKYQSEDPSIAASIVNAITNKASETIAYISFTDNAVYSPLGDYASSLLKTEDNLAIYKSLSELVNVRFGDFSLSSQAAFATTEAKDEHLLPGQYEANNVSYFSGKVDELSNSLSRFYNREIRLMDSGDYSLDDVELSDRFSEPIAQTEDIVFKGKEEKAISALAIIQDAYFYSSSEYSSVMFNVGKTALTIFMNSDSSVNPSLALNSKISEIGERKRVKISIPEFKLSSKLLLASTIEYFVQQDNSFSFDKYGVEGSSFTIMGPTSTSPDYDVAFTVDKPFMFASSYQSLPLFIGSVFSL